MNSTDPNPEKSTQPSGRTRGIAIATGIAIVVVVGAVILGGRLIGAGDDAAPAQIQAYGEGVSAPAPVAVPPGTAPAGARQQKNMWDPDKPPGPNYVWSKEHGHWHNAPPKNNVVVTNGPPPDIGRINAIHLKVEPPPTGKIWSKELHKFVDANLQTSPVEPPKPPPSPADTP